MPMIVYFKRGTRDPVAARIVCTGDPYIEVTVDDCDAAGEITRRWVRASGTDVKEVVRVLAEALAKRSGGSDVTIL